MELAPYVLVINHVYQTLAGKVASKRHDGPDELQGEPPLIDTTCHAVVFSHGSSADELISSVRQPRSAGKPIDHKTNQPHGVLSACPLEVCLCEPYSAQRNIK
jgi:hypothetical protein